MKLTLINGAEVRALLPMDRCVDLMRRALAMAPSDRAVQPLRTILQTPDRTGALGLMPGWIADPDRLGVKIVTVFPGNHGGPLGSHQGVILLADAANGAPLALIDAREVTAIRTAAASAAATDVLARGDVRTLALLGLGDQARAHLDSMLLVRAFERVLVWGRDAAKTDAFVAEQSQRIGRPVEAARTVEAAVRAGEVLCTLTAASDPIVRGAWIADGAHVNAVGSSSAASAEIDAEAVARARYFADFEPGVRGQSGDFRRAVAAGAVTEDHLLGAVGDVMSGRIPGRRSPSDVTLFKSLGMACEDLVAADFILTEARRQGVGQVIAW